MTGKRKTPGKTVRAGIDERRSAAAACGLLAFACATSAGAQVTLYEREDFGGAQYVVGAPMRNLERTGFNDRARSMIVGGGQWQLCTDAGFQGDCRVYRPGRYPSIELAGKVSSLRPLNGGGGGYVQPPPGGYAPPPEGYGPPAGGHPPSGGYPPPAGGYAPPPPPGGPAVTLFEYEDLSGARYAVTGPMPNLDRTGFNDRASAIVIRRGVWQLCSDAYFQGECQTLRPGEYSLWNIGLGRKLSSLRPLSP